MPPNDGQDGIVLGPGNEVTNVPQNERLLALIQQAPVWETEKALRLSQFLQEYPGNVPLGKHVALVALAMQAGPQAVQLSLLDYATFDENLERGLGPVLENMFEAEDEPGNRALAAGNSPDAQDKVNITVMPFQIFYRRVPVNGIGLLVETFVPAGADQAQNVRHFILGVAPAFS